MSEGKKSSFFKRLFGIGEEAPKPIETPPPPKQEPPGKDPGKKEPPKDRPAREEPPERKRLPKEAAAKSKRTPKPKGPPPAGPHPHPGDAGKSTPSSEACAAARRPRSGAGRHAARGVAAWRAQEGKTQSLGHG